MTDDAMRRHLTPEEAAELRRRARERRAQADREAARRGGAPRERSPEPPPRRRPAPEPRSAERGPAERPGRAAPPPPPPPRRSQDPSGIQYQPRQDPEPYRTESFPRRRGEPSRGARGGAAAAGYRGEPRDPRDPRDPRGHRAPPPPRRGARSGSRPPGRDGVRHASRHASRHAARRGRTPRKRIGLGRILALVLAVVLTLGVVSVIWADSKLTRIDAIENYSGRPANTPGRLTLIVGTDSRDGLSAEQQAHLSTGSEADAGGKRTDTMMLAFTPRGSDNPMLISLPRDMLVDVPGYGETKLNAAYAYGGPHLLVQTLEQQSGVRIDHYMEIGFGGFAQIVDAVGGIEVCLDQPISDPLAGIELAAGCQELDGPQSLGFVRTRYGFAEQDLARVRNQRMFLNALADEITSPGVILNPFTSIPLFNSSAEAVTVDTGDHVWDLARVLWGLRGDLVTATLPFDGFGSGAVGSYLVWGTNTQSFFDSIRSGRTPPSELYEELPNP